MKNFYNVYRQNLVEQDLPTIYCDMDMVLCDFLKGAEKELGKPFMEFDKDKRWPIISQNKKFWEELEWMPGAKRLWSFVNKYDAHILSAYSTNDSNSIPAAMVTGCFSQSPNRSIIMLRNILIIVLHSHSPWSLYVSLVWIVD